MAYRLQSNRSQEPLMTHRVKSAVPKRASVTLFLLIVTLSAGAGEVPDVIVDEFGPVWVAADVAVTPQGRLRALTLGAFGESVERNARAAAERARGRLPAPDADGCETYTGLFPEHVAPTGSLDDLTSHAGDIVSGRVTGVRQGFFGGIPASLLRIEATYLKGSAPLETYLLYPLARIAIAGAPLCSKPMGEFAPPQPGDRVLIFSMSDGPDWNSRRIFQVRTDRELVHEPRRGGLLVPAALRPYAGDRGEFDAVLQAVVQRLGKDSVPAVKQ
jgi:hypothetical protein